MFTGGDMADFLINFANNLNPNGLTVLLPVWPKWSNSTGNPTLLNLAPGLFNNRTLISDTYREGPINLMIDLARQYPL